MPPPTLDAWKLKKHRQCRQAGYKKSGIRPTTMLIKSRVIVAILGLVIITACTHLPTVDINVQVALWIALIGVDLCWCFRLQRHCSDTVAVRIPSAGALA
jgi:hypothetical protein